MSTTSTIGTSSRNYSTIASWLAAFTTGGWIGECYADSEFTITSNITFSGQAVGASDFIILRSATGQSAFDTNTNPLKYDATKGVAIRKTNNYGVVLEPQEDYITFSKLQIQGGGNGCQGYSDAGGGNPHGLLSRCLFYIPSNNSAGAVRAGSTPVQNCVVMIGNATGPGIRVDYGNASPIINNTFACFSDNPTTDAAIIANGGTTTFKNNAFFGFGSIQSGGGTLTGSNNATDLTSVGFGTSNQALLTFALQFVGTTSLAPDFRTKTGAGLLDNGVTDSTDIPAANDIFGTSRPQGSAWDIGAHELIVSSGVTGTAAIQEIQDSMAASGAVLVSGTAALTELRDTMVASGGVLVSGTSAMTEIQDAMAASGTVASGILGTSALTEIQDAMAASGAVLVSGTAALQEIRDTFAASGNVTLPAVTGTSALVETQDRMNAQGSNGVTLIDYDAGKYVKKANKARDREFETEREKSARRRKQVMDAFEAQIEGGQALPEEVAQQIVQAIEGGNFPPGMNFDAILANLTNIEALWREYLDKDDEDVMVLL